MSRPVGNHIRAICTVLEEIGPATTRQIFEKTDGIGIENVSKYASRAVGLGMASVQVGSNKPKDCNVYTISEGWRERIAPRAKDVAKSSMRQRIKTFGKRQTRTVSMYAHHREAFDRLGGSKWLQEQIEMAINEKGTNTIQVHPANEQHARSPRSS